MPCIGHRPGMLYCACYGIPSQIITIGSSPARTTPTVWKPGNASGGMAGIASKPLTVDFHANGFVSTLNRENQLGPWFTLSDQERRQVGAPWGPSNP